MSHSMHVYAPCVSSHSLCVHAHEYNDYYVLFGNGGGGGVVVAVPRFMSADSFVVPGQGFIESVRTFSASDENPIFLLSGNASPLCEPYFFTVLVSFSLCNA